MRHLLLILLMAMGPIASSSTQAPCPFTEASKCSGGGSTTPSSSSNWPEVPLQTTAQTTTVALILYTYEGNYGTFPSTAAQTVLAYWQNHEKPIWEQNSYGYRLMTIPKVYGPYVLPRPTGADPASSLYDPNSLTLVNDVARDVPATVTEKVYYYPQFSGKTDNGGSCRAIEGMCLWDTGWVGQFNKLNGYTEQFQGYKFGVPFDGQGLSCRAANGTLVPLSLNCQEVLRIGDPVAVKAGGHIAAQFKPWISLSNRTVVTSPGTYHLSPLELWSTSPIYLQISLPGDWSYYTMEYRLPIGPDAQWNGTKLVNAVLIRRDIALIDMHPYDTTTKNHQGMLVGETLTTPYGHAFTLLSADANGAVVQVQ